MDAVNYKSLPVQKLKAELIRRGAVTTGRKENLVDRLIAYDRNRDFKPPKVILPGPLDADWPQPGYTKLLTDHRILFAKLTREQIDEHFLYRLAGDRQASGDIKALEKGADLYQGNRILACSIHITVEWMYLSGIVGAAMKKQVNYNFKVKLERSSGSPLNSDCECPAGKGPHSTCKHIAAVLLMLQNFSNTGKVTIEKSCTEGLQTFHKPKPSYDGAAITADAIPTKRKLSGDIFNNPRPAKYRNQPGYQDHVRNCIINYCAVTSCDIAMKYLYPKADIEAAEHDHDYMKLPLREYWVDHALKVSMKQTLNLEIETRGQAANKKWFQARHWRLTSSKFGAICNITNRRNINKFCQSLLSIRQINTNATSHGKMSESKAISKFESITGLTTKKSGLFVCFEKPYLASSPDAIINENEIVEVKCPYNGRNEKIKPSKYFPFLTYDGDQIVLKKCSNFYDQIQGQLFISKRKLCHFVVFTFCDIFIQKIEIDYEYCNFCLIPKLELFYRKHFRPYIANNI